MNNGELRIVSIVNDFSMTDSYDIKIVMNIPKYGDKIDLKKAILENFEEMWNSITYKEEL